MIDRLARSCRPLAAVSIPASYLHIRVFGLGMYVARFRSALTQLQRGDGV